jgi:hypothetical protein
LIAYTWYPAGVSQRPHPQDTIGFNADDHLIRILDMLRDQLMQLSNADQSFGQSPRCQPLSALVHQIHFVMFFGPVIADEDHQSPPSLEIGCQSTCSSPREPSDKLMDQCSVARHPISATGTLTNEPGHDLALEVDAHSSY